MNVPPNLVRLVRLWVEKAENDLRNAVHTLTMDEDCPFDTVCFHAQQCAEKYVKALLTLREIELPNTHDLLELIWLLPEETGLRSRAEEISQINRYAVEARYPGDWEPIAREEAEAAVATARQVRQTVRALLPPEALG
jgi:HEPN domain-containing protein